MGKHEAFATSSTWHWFITIKIQGAWKEKKRKEIFNFSFMNLCYDQKRLVMPKIEWVWTCNAIILTRVLMENDNFTTNLSLGKHQCPHI